MMQARSPGLCALPRERPQTSAPQEGRGSRGHTELPIIGFLTPALAGEMTGAPHRPRAWRDHQVLLS